MAGSIISMLGGTTPPGRVATSSWGSFRGEDATLYTITHGGITAAVTDLGATLVQLELPDKDGEVRAVCGGLGSRSSVAAAGMHAEERLTVFGFGCACADGGLRPRLRQRQCKCSQVPTVGCTAAHMHPQARTRTSPR